MYPKPASAQLIGTTAPSASSGISAQNDNSSKIAAGRLPQVGPYATMHPKPVVHDCKYYYEKYKLKRCTVHITRLTIVSSKLADTTRTRPISIKLHQLPLKPSQRVKVKPPASPASKTSPTGIKQVISRRPQYTKHVFRMK